MPLPRPVAPATQSSCISASHSQVLEFVMDERVDIPCLVSLMEARMHMAQSRTEAWVLMRELLAQPEAQDARFLGILIGMLAKTAHGGHHAGHAHSLSPCAVLCAIPAPLLRSPALHIPTSETQSLQ